MKNRKHLYQRLKDLEHELYNLDKAGKTDYRRAGIVDKIEYLKEKLGYKNDSKISKI